MEQFSHATPHGSHSAHRIPPKRRSKLPFVLLGAVAVAAVIYVALVWAPVWFHLPVAVTINGKSYQVKSGTDIHTYLGETFDLSAYQGALKVDTGQVLDPKGGKPPRITVDGHALRKRERILRGGDIVLAKGADIVHKTAKRPVSIAEKTVLQGKGSLISLEHAGAAGTKLETVDTVTGKVLSSVEATAPIDTVLQAWQTSRAKQRVIALTFDDGPHPTYTQGIVAVLQQQKVPATFFELGTNIKRYPALTQACVNSGSLVGLHSWDHKDFTKLSVDQINKQIQDTQAIYKKTTGKTAHWFRLPYGNSTTQIDGQLTTQGLNLAYWTVDTNDWRRPGADTIAARAISGAAPGAIILMHDGGGDRSQTVAALPKIITTLKAQGYTFVTVDQLYHICSGK